MRTIIILLEYARFRDIKPLVQCQTYMKVVELGFALRFAWSQSPNF